MSSRGFTIASAKSFRNRSSTNGLQPNLRPASSTIKPCRLMIGLTQFWNFILKRKNRLRRLSPLVMTLLWSMTSSIASNRRPTNSSVASCRRLLLSRAMRLGSAGVDRSRIVTGGNAIPQPLVREHSCQNLPVLTQLAPIDIAVAILCSLQANPRSLCKGEKDEYQIFSSDFGNYIRRQSRVFNPRSRTRRRKNRRRTEYVARGTNSG